METNPSSDNALAAALARQDIAASSELTGRFPTLLQPAFEKMRTDTPGCVRTFGELLPHVGKSIGRGFEALVGNCSVTFCAYIPTLHLADLFLAAACLQKDGPAWERLIRTTRLQVIPGLLKHWVGRVGVDEVRRVGSDLPGHCLQEFSKGTNAGAPRLATYQGRASLTSWLFATAVRLLQEQGRQKQRAIQENREFIEDLAITPQALQPENALLHKEADKQGADYRQALVKAIKATIEEMPPRRRLAAVLRWVYLERPADIANKMRVSRPRITELLNEAEEQFRKTTIAVCQEIAEATSRPVAQVQDLMMTDLNQLLD